MKKTIFLLSFIGILNSFGLGFADTIYLKDGRVIQGKIVEKSSYAVTIQQGTALQKFFNEQIQKIEEEQKQVPAPTATAIDPYQFVDITPEKAQWILKLIDINGTRAAMENQLNQIVARSSSQDAQKVKDLVNVNDILKQLVPVYDRYYSEEDLKDLIAFYESPLGQKVMRVTPLLMKDTLQATLEYFKNKVTP